tara:strand:- start:77 stop:604 length:528 start_codon:yes stop_codon:yes gene_type:complete
MENYNFSVSWIPITDNLQPLIGVSACPGKLSAKKGSNKRLVADLESICRQNVSCIITLATKQEIELLGIGSFNETVKRLGFKHYIEPIEDFSVPRISRTLNIKDLLEKIMSEFKENKKILIHCNAGFGRSGTIAAVLVKLIGGYTDPIAHLRKYLPGAVETMEQERYICNFNCTG